MSIRIGLALWLILLTAVPLAAQPQTSTLLLTEFLYNPPGADDEREWIEIANVGTAVLDLSNVKVGDEETAGGGEGMRRFPDGAQIEPDQVIVVAQTAAGFRALYGRSPDYEIIDTDPAVPDMRGFPLWAGGDLALNNNGDEILLLDGMAIIDQLSYGDSREAFNPPIASAADGQSVARIPANCDTDSAADWQPQTMPTPGQISLDGLSGSDSDCAIPENPAESEALPPIGSIQGSGAVSPFVNENVTFRAVVTGAYEDINTSGVTYYTLFVQDLPGQEDGDPATSDGMAIFLGRRRGVYRIGDQLRIVGLVTEFYGYTEIDDAGLEIAVEANDAPLPEPIPIAPPTGRPAQTAYFEPLESMLVALDGAANVIGPTYSGCGFAAARAESGLERVYRRSANDLAGPIITVLHNSDVDCGAFPNVKVGDSVNGVNGPLIYNFDEFKVVQQATTDLVVTAVPFPPIPAPPTSVANQFAIASLNVENHFDSIDDTGDDAEPKPTTVEIAVKQRKLAYAIGHTLGCPALIGIQEVENEALLLDLATETAVICGFTYDVTHRESADTRGIDVALLSDPRRATVIDAALRQTCAPLNTSIQDDAIVCEAGQSPLFSRPPLQVDVAVDEIDYTIFVNHFKSKRGGEAETAPRRAAQATHIVTLVKELQAQDAQARIVVLGDFNDYEQSPPLAIMTANGVLTNALRQLPEAERYSFVYGGASQLIDGILVSDNLVEAVTAVTIQHVNADFPDSLGADTGDYLAYKATDHDLSLLILSADTSNMETPPPTTAPPSATPTSTNDNDEPEESGSNWFLWLLGGLAAATAALAALFRRR
ncbi:MAG: hypothetical protein GY803_30735 [Chloroflexi bacterium]|nr:hypothetical protein [Chloroflexota bacterium]